MTPQRHFKAIDDYPSKFDWPGIKGLMQVTAKKVSLKGWKSDIIAWCAKMKSVTYDFFFFYSFL